MTADTGPDLWFLDDGRILGGGQRFALRLAQHVVEQHPSTHVTFLCPASSQLSQVAQDAGLATHDLDFPDPVPSALRELGGAARRLRGLLRGRDPQDLILVGNSARAQAVAMLACGTMRHHPPLVNLMQERDSAGRRSVQLTHRVFGRVVAVGGNSAAAYREAVGAARVTGANNFLLPGELAKLASQRRPNPSTDPPVIGVLGRLIPEKGTAEFVAELASSGATWSRLILGGLAQDPAYAERVERAVADAALGDRITFAGEVPDAHAFLADIDILAVPSTGNEGQPTVIVEGLAAGLRIVVRRPMWSADFDGLPVVPYSDAGDLAPAVEQAAGADAAALDLLAERFGPEQALRALFSAAGVAPPIA